MRRSGSALNSNQLAEHYYALLAVLGIRDILVRIRTSG